MYIVLLNLCLIAVSAEAAVGTPAIEANPILTELMEKGVMMSDGKAYKLPTPAMADAFDATSQKAAMEKSRADAIPLTNWCKKPRTRL